jgi:hypothetical protein
MITSAFISMFSWLIYGASILLPSGTFLPSNFSSNLSLVVSYAYGWDWLIPVGTLFAVFSAIIIFFWAELTWRAFKWFIHLLRGN